MQSNAIYLSYKPLEIQSNYSVSNERKEIYTQTIQNQMEEQGLSGTAEWYIAPESFIQAHSYLTSNIDNPLSFKSTLEQEQSLVSKATSQMQDFLISPHLAILKENQSMDFTGKNTGSKNTFGGYSTDEYGFMGEDFNKAAGLPNDSKIHKNALQALNDFYTISIHSSYESIDLIAGISYANQELNSLLTSNKEYYTKAEIMQMTKGSKGEFYENDFNTLLMQDYSNEKGEFKKEGILLMYAMKSGAFENAESPYTIEKESKNNTTIINQKEKTAEEKAKETKDALMDYYMKALEESRKENEDSVSNSIAKETNKKSINQLEESLMDKETKKLKNYFAGGEWIKVRV